MGSVGFATSLQSLTHRRRDLFYLPQQDLDFGADIGQDMTKVTLGIGCGVSLLQMLTDFLCSRLYFAARRMFFSHCLTLASLRGTHADAVWASVA